MVVMILESVPPSLRGEITRWMIQPKAGVFVGKVSAMVRDKLWEKVRRAARGGSGMIWPRKNGHLVRLPRQRSASRRRPGPGSPGRSAAAADCRKLRCTRTAPCVFARAVVEGHAGPTRT